MKLAIITCYRQPDYIRGQTLRAAAAEYPGIELIIIKNSNTGVMRYPEVIWKVVKARLTRHPDVYLITFRGYEILMAAGLLTWPKTLIYDEFINPIEWLQEPREQHWAHYAPISFLSWFYRLLLKRAKFILADTGAHASYTAAINRLPEGRVVTIPVSTNEKLFRPGPAQESDAENKKFRVLYYGSMLPLHGLSYVLDAALALVDLPIEFLLVGGKDKAAQAINLAKTKGADVIYKDWIDFEKLPDEILNSDLCMGGPFGNTMQANMVITGKTYQFMASGAPTLIGDTKVKAKFRDRENCLIVPQADAAALASSIRWAYQNQDKLKAIGSSGYELYKAEFSQAVVAKKFAAMIDSLS